MSWLIDAKVRSIEIERNCTREELSNAIQKGVPFWNFKEVRQRKKKIIQLNSYIHGLDKATEILQNRNIK